MKIYNLVKNHLKKNKILLVMYITLTMILAMFSVIIPFLSGNFIDNLITRPTTDFIYQYTLIYIGIALIQIFFSYLMSIVSVKIITKITFEFNESIIKHIQKISLIKLEKMDLIYLNQRISSDSNIIINFCITIINGITANSISFILCFLYIFNINSIISFFIAMLILLYILLFKSMKNKISQVKYELKEIQAVYVSSLQEQLYKIRMMKIYKLFDFFHDRLIVNFVHMLNICIKNTKINFLFQSSDSIITLISQILLFLYGGFEIINGNLSIGSFTILSSYFSTLVSNTKFFVSIGNQYIDNKVSADRIYELLDIPEEKNGIKKLDKINNIELKNISFNYNKKRVFSNFSYYFSNNKIYQITGSNGRGKTTLINILIGLYNNYIGEVLYNHENIKNLDLYNIRKNNLSYISQDLLVFNGTIMENITFSNDKIGPLKEIKSYFDLFDFETNNKENIEKKINSNATNLSGGELKKIELIRFLYSKTTSLLILDEPSNSLDMESKETLKKELLGLKEDRIIIIISHDPCFEEIIDEKIEL